MTTLVGRTVSHYKILEQLGGGAMGVVYKARQLKPDRLVALKFLPPRLTRNPDAKKRFIQEVRTASAIQHSNIAPVYDIGETDDGQIYVAMEFYAGETLKKTLTRGPVPFATALEVAFQTARGLGRAHKRGIIHRDIRPSNIFITSDGTVKIVDFGLAMLAAESRSRSVTAFAAAPDYMSPEQVGKGTVDARSDIWSLGVVLFELLTGKRPFKGKNPQEVIHAILTAPPPRPSVAGNDIPDDLDDVLLQALRKNPAERFRDADDFAHVLESTKHLLSPGAWQSASRRFFTPFVRYQKRETRSSLLPVVLLILLLLAVAYLLWG